jgi:hypothetical protein
MRRACLLAAHVDVAMRDLGIQREFTEQTTRTRLDALLYQSLPSAERARLEARGAAMRTEEAVTLALAALEELPVGA